MIVARIAAQNAMDWIQIGSTFGIPVLMLIGIAYFTARNVWPFVVKRIEQNDARHQIETDKFLAAVEKLANAQAESSAARDRVQSAQNEAINNLTNAIKALQQVRGSGQQ